MLHFYGSKLNLQEQFKNFKKNDHVKCTEMMIPLTVGHEVALWVLNDSRQ